MSKDDEVTEDFRAELRDAVEQTASREADWPAFHARLNAGPVAERLAELRRRVSGGYRVTVAAGAAWWDYAARAALAGVPLGIAAALILVTYLRSGGTPASDAPTVIATVAVAPASSDSARAAFESVLTGDAAPRAVMAALMPVPGDAFAAETVGGQAR